jgi:hypothetical protein
MSNEKFLVALSITVLLIASVFYVPPACAAGQDGMVVVRDPQTGQMRTPTPAELKALTPQAPAMLQPPPRPVLVTHPDGSRKVYLGEKSMVYSVVTKDAEGKLHDQCVQGEHAAQAALGQSAPAKHNQEQLHETR